MAAVDAKRGGEASWAACEIEKPSCLALLLHERNPFQWFDGANEDRGGNAGRFTDDIQHEVRAIVEKYIDVARGEVHRANARSRAAEMMAGGIARRICFRLHNTAAEPALREIVDDDFPDEEARELDGVRRKLGPANAADCEFLR